MEATQSGVATPTATLPRRSVVRKTQLKARLLRPESGQVAVIVTLMIVVLCGLAGLAVDEGVFQNDRRKMQAAADSAAIAGDQEILSGNSDTVTLAARNDAEKNG